MKKIFIILLLLLVATNVYAVSDPLRPGGGEIQSLDDVIDKILSWLWPITTVITALMIVIGAMFLVTGGGNPEQINKGKKVIIFALIGFAIVTASKGILELVRILLGIE